jgi:hypothetical protein
MCRHFTHEVVGQRRRLKAIKKIVAQKTNVILFFDIEFFKYVSEFYSSFTFQKHPVCSSFAVSQHKKLSSSLKFYVLGNICTRLITLPS